MQTYVFLTIDNSVHQLAYITEYFYSMMINTMVTIMNKLHYIYKYMTSGSMGYLLIVCYLLRVINHLTSCIKKRFARKYLEVLLLICLLQP